MTEGALHVYHEGRNLNIFEHLPRSSGSHAPPKHVLLFVGGLFDTFNLPQYVTDLAALFPLHSTQEWRVMHIQLSSQGRSWGIFDIDRDIEEIAICINFLRDKLFKNSGLDVVLMGHSTGCQDVMRYLTAPNPLNDRKPARPVIQGAILQAPVSDRDAMNHTIEEGPEAKKAYDSIMKTVDATPEHQRRDVVLPLNLMRPLLGLVPVSIARFLSLASPESPANPSVEDFFSSDLSDSTLRKTFGVIGRNRMLNRPTGDGARDVQSLLVLMSDSDGNVSGKTSQKALLTRWKEVTRDETGASIHDESAVILNAMHDVGGDDWPSQEARLVVLRKKVIHYLKHVVGGIDQTATEIWHKDGDRVMAMKSGDGRSIEDKVGVLKL